MEKYSFEEYKLMYLSTEKVTDRRLTNNKTNYSINIAVLAAIAVIWKWTISNPDYFFCGIILVFILAMFAIFYCSLWVGQITDFKKLNQAKFEVINEMASNLKFDSNNDKDVDIKSYEPFEKEWTKLNSINALQASSSNNLIALKSTNSEYFLPKALRVIFILVASISVLTLILNFEDTWNGIKLLLKIG